jgi:tryptophan synthase alpha chain
MAGDPDLDRSLAYAVSVARGGADILEVGLPFSDPIADGPVLQAAAHRALASGTRTRQVLDLVRRVRGETGRPVAVMTYYNPVFVADEAAFLRSLRDAGGDGLIVPDLPAEEAGSLASACAAAGVDLIPLVTPATPPERIAQVVSRPTGFVYVVSRYGTTGAREFSADAVRGLLRSVRGAANGTPILVGFGVSRPEQAQELVAMGADGVVVGTAIVDRIARGAPAGDVEAYVRQLTRGLRAA